MHDATEPTSKDATEPASDASRETGRGAGVGASVAHVEGVDAVPLDIAYRIFDGRPAGADTGPGSPHRSWVITPGGRFSKDDPGVHEFAEALADRGQRCLIWDRPNCGASSVCFSGVTESDMQADALAALLRHLDYGPTVIAGGSGGARVSLLTAARHPDMATGLAIWWISGGVVGSISLGFHYCRDSIAAAWHDDMATVADLPAWQEVQRRNPSNRQRFLDLDRTEFLATMERWMLAYCPCDDDMVVAGLTRDEAHEMTKPTLVFRGSPLDFNHPEATSLMVADALPNARLAEPPWGGDEWKHRQDSRARGEGGIFSGWFQLVPQLLEWADEAIA